MRYFDAKVPCLQQLIQAYEETGASILGVQEVPKEKVSSYGVVASETTDKENTWLVKDMIEKPAIEEAPSQLAVLGRYIINPEIFEILENVKPGKGDEIQLTDALKILAKQQPMYAYCFQGRRYDLGDKQGFFEATVEFALKRDELRDGLLEYLKDIVKKNE